MKKAQKTKALYLKRETVYDNRGGETEWILERDLALAKLGAGQNKNS